MQAITSEITCSLPCTLFVQRGTSPFTLVLLHGYADSPTSLTRRLQLESHLPTSALVPRGPFPVPQYKNGLWKEAFAWYFREGDGSKTLIPPEVGARMVVELLRLAPDLIKNPVVLCGYSQGGILAPYVARLLDNVKAMVHINTRYKAEDYRGLTNIPVFGVHGCQDEIISVRTAKTEYEALAPLGFQGSLQTIPGEGHQIGKKIATLFWQRIESLKLSQTP